MRASGRRGRLISWRGSFDLDQRVIPYVDVSFGIGSMSLAQRSDS